MKLDQEKLQKNMQSTVAVHLYDSIDSTNDEAKRRLWSDKGVHLYAASRQEAGRGRRGNRFYSPDSTGLYMTLSLPLCDNTAGVQKITCAAAVAVCGAIESLSEIKPRIKWVNDIFVGGKKAGGILTELITDSNNYPTAVIVGIGLNLTTESFPVKIADKAGNIGDIDMNQLCGTIVDWLISLYGNLNDNSFLEKYKSLNLCIGQIVRYTKDGAEHQAKALDIDDNGGLIVEENGIRTTLNSGEISVVL